MSERILVVHVLIRKDEEIKYRYGFPIVGFFSRKNALQYKRQREDRDDLIIKRLEIH